MSGRPFNRRDALAAFGALMAASPLLRSQQQPPLIGERHGRIAPVGELVNSLEYEPMAQRMLSDALYREIAGGDRAALERITFRPRMMVPVPNLDLTTDLFGDKMFAPILVAPMAEQKRFHPEGELGMARGAAAAKATLVLSSRSSVPLEQVAAEAKSSFWYQVYPEADQDALKARMQQAVKAGCKAVCITVGTPYQRDASAPPNPAKLQAIGNPKTDWAAIDRLRQGIGVPVVLKGIMSPEEVQEAVKRGVQGIVVSNHGGRYLGETIAPIEALPAVADAVAGRIPILMDGSIRRGSDVLKALCLGATAVLLGRPMLWALTAYGATGVQTLLEKMQTETAADMAMCGRENVKALNRDAVKIHRR
jgi:4-hydroxymandelate oxidase